MKPCMNTRCGASVWQPGQIYCSGSCQVAHERRVAETEAFVAPPATPPFEGGLLSRLGRVA